MRCWIDGVQMVAVEVSIYRGLWQMKVGDRGSDKNRFFGDEMQLLTISSITRGNIYCFS